MATQVSSILSKLGVPRREMLLEERLSFDRRTHPLELGGDTLICESVRIQAPNVEGLTSAEQVIVDGIFRDMSNEEIADEKCRSASTVANQVQAVFEKLDVKSRSGLIQKVVKMGIHAGGL